MKAAFPNRRCDHPGRCSARFTQQSATEEDLCGTAADRASIANFLINTPESSANSNLPIEVASTLRSFNLSHLRRLPCTRLEADSILPLVPDPNQKAAVFDFNANYDWMTQANSQLDQYRIIHLATHGFANEEKPELSMLVLSLVDPQGNTQNGMLRLRDIFNLKLNADMVVLSACQTGQGETVRGEGLIGITRGFMYAGAKRVVNSLWYVDDAKTAELMVRFYRGILEENLSPTAALQKAQIQMWETYKKPDLWAAFTIQGEWRIQN
ncbi:CHAT domain-containing protein [Leptolyngbya sp. 7M]|uniref:CHAT domain-containing protein n=1 Tax=Leptolyngbya sp. 7M TaxID=2812896 RepID=UPI001B8D03D5|nr:CHAT domain-containing protein [Leptolyngbya sp. 7M]QYO64375.1 CHAT domain-containing protein [Leptolyngbya sp. 7M]